MKRSLHILILLVVSILTASATTFQNETLKYRIAYKWGLIHKDAGTATLTLTNSGGNYNVRLVAHSLPWVDHIYSVRDTLSASIRKSDFKVLTYKKVTNEDGKYRRDVINYKYAGNHAYGTCSKYRKNKGKPASSSTKSFSSTGPTYDMLSIFYYIRALDVPNLKKGTKYVCSLFSGSGVERVTIRTKGKETVKGKGKSYQTYHLQFTFTSHSGSKTSEPMDVWVTQAAPYIPVKLVGQLPIGHVQCLLQ